MPMAVAQLGSSAAGKETEVARLTRELNEAREQQTATSSVLEVISLSAFDLHAVFETVAESSVSLCEADRAFIFRFDGELLRMVVTYNASPEFAEWVANHPIQPGRHSGSARAALERRTIHIPDVQADPEFSYGAKDFEAVRTLLAVPILKGADLLGVMILNRLEVRPFSDQQIALVETFADQAAIAIENVRLLDELRQRTTDLTEALEQQTATAEGLKVISRSQFDLQLVLDTLIATAASLCGAKRGAILRRDGELYRAAAFYNASPEFIEFVRSHPIAPGRHTITARVALERRAIHVADLQEDAEYTYALRDTEPIRTELGVPMFRGEDLVGVFILYKLKVEPFTDKQIELVTTFADQAVIAIENARLLNELRQRTTDLTEALQQQTATADVLKVISRSQFDLQLVLDNLIETAASLCDAKRGVIVRRDGDLYHGAAFYNASPDLIDFIRRHPIAPGRHTITGRALLERHAVHVADLQEDAEYAYALRDVEPIRTLLAVPMFRGDDLVGAVILYKLKVHHFTDKQIELVTTFADQAVIAIENVRLLTELRERTGELERSYALVQQQASQLEVQSQELVKLNQQLEQRVADQVGEIERMSRLRRFLPPQVADLIVASGSEKQLESHRREITALFCDLRGFTGFSESADPEDVMTLLREYHEALGASINKYSGTLERYAGDGVMVVFNDPVPVESPALQAVLMALEMRDAIGALTETWRRLGHDIGFGVGIAHGFATLGTIGFEGRFDYAAIGTVSNVASRLCDEAKPGQILISPRVLMKVENAVKVEPVGEFELKGIRRPLAAYNVVAAV